MSSKRYFRHDAESDHGVGVAFMEITEGWPSRQVEFYGKTAIWGDEQNPEHLADQPFDVLELQPEHEIDAAEFEEAWRRAHAETGGT
jgi:hypothetical protein